MKKLFQQGFSRKGGNTLLEYAVPAALIIISGGFIIGVTDVKKLMGEYFLAGSGRTKSALSGTTLKTQALVVSGAASGGNGSAGFPGLSANATSSATGNASESLFP